MLIASQVPNPSTHGKLAIQLVRREGSVYFHLGRPIPLEQLMDGRIEDIPMKNGDVVQIITLPKSDAPVTQPAQGR